MNNLEKAKELKKKVDTDYKNAQMYADMDEEDFWRTSIINQKEAQKRANAIWVNIIKDIKDLKELKKDNLYWAKYWLRMKNKTGCNNFNKQAKELKEKIKNEGYDDCQKILKICEEILE